MEILKQYVVTMIIFFAIDMVWLGFIAKKIYRENIGHLMAPSANWPAAAVFYALYIGGILFFVINPALEKDSMTSALMLGAIYGFITYATYDMTNLATLKDWPLKITIIDILWGTGLNTLTAAGSFYILKLIG